jgi:hypothetical protein
VFDSPAWCGEHQIGFARMRQERKRKPPPNPVDPVKAVFIAFALRTVLDPLVSRLGAAHPEVQRAFDASVEHLRRQYDRKLQAQALRLRRRCRKADVRRLWRLPGEKSPRILRLIQRLELAKGLGGRGVIPEPMTFDEALGNAFAVWPRIAAAKPNERRDLRKNNMPKYSTMIEAAYRGELTEARRKIGDRKAPHSKASEIAEDKVAEAAGITRPLVHQICQAVRDDKSALKWAAARPGRGVVPEPATTAAQLRHHLES